MSGRYLCLIFLWLIIPEMVSGQDQDGSRRAVIQTARQYIEAMYKADAGMMDQCLHEKFIKYGYYWKGGTGTFSEAASISRDQMKQIAKDWNKDQWVPDDAPRDVAVLDLQEKIAVIRLTAFWGVEYLQLAGTDSGWRIIMALSQNWPKKLIGEEEDK